MICDGRGTPLKVITTAANVNDVTQTLALVDGIPPAAGRPGHPRRRPSTSCRVRSKSCGVCRNTLPGLGSRVRLGRRHDAPVGPQHLELCQLPADQLLQDVRRGNADRHHAHRTTCLPRGSERSGRAHAQGGPQYEGNQVRLERQLALNLPRKVLHPADSAVQLMGLDSTRDLQGCGLQQCAGAGPQGR
ncbi:MAG: hypothetical protein HOV70_03955 [Streptomyces sp.]|nr:hypothetical protein [Streptomyces sp.]NUS23180.1 hypothetical protein [Streptomyces sp.]NUS75340.1 hypothetical protein [Streptomyces sp.]NUT29757.1 hypothetical protein [Streptomyces sp.]